MTVRRYRVVRAGKHSAWRGFTLIELVVTVAIVAILAMATVPFAQMTMQRSKEQDLRQALRQIREAIDRYRQLTEEGRIVRKSDESGYPKTLEALVEGIQDAKDPSGARLYLLRRVPRDPMAADQSAPAAQTWGLRSYASPPGDPRPGADVFDVYSLSEASGLNGVRYRDW